MSLTKLQTAASTGSFYCKLFLPLFLSFDCQSAPLNIPNVYDLVMGKVVASNISRYWQ